MGNISCCTESLREDKTKELLLKNKDYTDVPKPEEFQNFGEFNNKSLVDLIHKEHETNKN